MTQQDAINLLNRVNMGKILNTRHLVEAGHYNLAKPDEPPKGEQSYFTAASFPALLSVLNETVQPIDGREIRMNSTHSNQIRVYRQFKDPIGKNRVGRECKVCCVILGRESNGEPRFIDAWPVEEIPHQGRLQ